MPHEFSVTMATTAASMTGLGHVGECHQRGGGSNPQLGPIPDLDTISNSGQQQYQQQLVNHALTPPPQLPSSPWYRKNVLAKIF